MSNSPFYTVIEVARILGCSQQTVRNLISRGALSVTTHGHVTRVCKSDVDDYLDAILPAAKGLDEISRLSKEITKESNALAEELEQLRRDRSAAVTSNNVFINVFVRRAFDFLRAGHSVSGRNKQILLMFLDGYSLVQIGDAMSISRERVRQLLERILASSAEYLGHFSALIDSNRELHDRIVKLEVALCLKDQQMRDYALKHGDRYVEGRFVKQDVVDEYARVLDLLNTRLIELPLSVRCLNCLRAFDYDYISDVVQCNKEDLLKARNFGKKSLWELEDLIENLGLYFGMDITPYKSGLRSSFIK